MFQTVPTTRSQYAILAIWFLLALLAYPFASKVNQHLESSARLHGSESAAVEASLHDRFKSPFTKIALLRIADGPAPLSSEGREALKVIIDAIKSTPGVLGALSYLDRGDRLFVAKDQSSIVVVGLDPADSADEVMSRLRAATARAGTNLQRDYPALAFRWTGESAVNTDMRRLSAESTRAAELRVLPLTLLILLVAFRSVVSALLPMLCGAVTILVSLGVLSAVGQIWPASIIVVSIISMVGLGLSIDYALLIVSRYREDLAAGSAPGEAVLQATAHAGHTILVSGSAVAIGFAAMLLVPVSEVRSIGAGGLLVTAVAVLVSTTLLPVLLLRVAPWLDTGRVPIARHTQSGGSWRRWASWVARHPVGVLLAASAPLVFLATHAIDLRTDLPRGRWLPDSADSVLALHEIDAVTAGSFGQIIYVILNLPSGSSVKDESGWRATSRLVRHYAKDSRIQHVWAVTTLNVAPMGGPELLAKIPESARRSFLTDDGGAALIQLLPKQGLTATDAAAMAREIRASDPAALTGIAGAHLQVGGVPAFNIDYQDAITSSLGKIAAVVILSTLLVLAVAFRSILIPLKAVVLNLLSVAAAFGAVTLVFQKGYGAQWIGVPHALDGGFPLIPVLVFGIVFGLSMDYEVFMVARIADARRRGLSDVEALIDGISSMGRVISFAAAIMIAVFGGFVFGDFVLIKILGVALSVAVLVDATLIRLAIGPALILLAGRWNWWPGEPALGAKTAKGTPPG